jgi:hypothetical protein
VVGVAAAADHVLVATSRGFVLQYSWDDYGNEKSERPWLHLLPSHQSRFQHL